MRFELLAHHNLQQQQQQWQLVSKLLTCMMTCESATGGVVRRAIYITTNEWQSPHMLLVVGIIKMTPQQCTRSRRVND